MRLISSSSRGDALRDTVRLFSPISMNDGAEHDLLAVLGRRAGAQFARRRCTSATSRDADRHAVRVPIDDLRDLGDGRDLAGHAHQILLAVALDVAGADVGVVALPAPSSRRGSVSP